MEKKQIGFLGLGNMGLNMVLNLLDKGYEVHAWNRSAEKLKPAEKAGAKVYTDLKKLSENLKSPKIIWSMVSAGPPVDEMIEHLVSENLLQNGDIFVDGVNSYYKDSVRRGKSLSEKGIYFFDCGVSGGIEGARTGACLMIGGDKNMYEKHLAGVLKDLATRDGYGYFGGIGAGHFVKMVHNAIEYGMMQAMAEGFNLIERSQYADTDMEKLADVWNHGSIISGNLMYHMKNAFSKEADLAHIDPEVGSLGTGEWAVMEAMHNEVPFVNISNSVFARFNSRTHDDFGAKIVQALRNEFGGHNSKQRPEGK